MIQSGLKSKQLSKCRSFQYLWVARRCRKAAHYPKVLKAAEVDGGRDSHHHPDLLIRPRDRLLPKTKLGALKQNSQNRLIRDDSVSFKPRDVSAAPKEQVVPKNHSVQEISEARKSAEFCSFFCAQTTTISRVALLLVSAGWVLVGAAVHTGGG